jgi:hypothetical protein
MGAASKTRSSPERRAHGLHRTDRRQTTSPNSRSATQGPVRGQSSSRPLGLGRVVVAGAGRAIVRAHARQYRIQRPRGGPPGQSTATGRRPRPRSECAGPRALRNGVTSGRPSASSTWSPFGAFPEGFPFGGRSMSRLSRPLAERAYGEAPGRVVNYPGLAPRPRSQVYERGGARVNGHDVLLVGGRLRSRSTDSRNPGGRTAVLA